MVIKSKLLNCHIEDTKLQPLGIFLHPIQLTHLMSVCSSWPLDPFPHQREGPLPWVAWAWWLKL